MRRQRRTILQENEKIYDVEKRIIPEEFQQFEFSFIVKKKDFKHSITDKANRNSEKFGVKYFLQEEKIEKNTPYQLKIKIKYANYYSKCDAEKFNFLNVASAYIQNENQ